MFVKLVVWLCFLSIILNQVSGLCSEQKDCGSCTQASEGLEVCCWNATKNSCLPSLLGVCRIGGTRLSYNCPTELPKFVYTDDFGRSKALPYIAAAYGTTSTEAQQCLTNTLPGARVYRQYFASPCANGTCSATLSYSMYDQAIVVSFRGAEGEGQFLQAATDLLNDEKLPFPTGGNVYHVYRNAFYTFWNEVGLEKGIKYLKNLYPSYEFWAFGHSLGSGMASLTSSYVVKSGLFSSEKVKMVTTGQTRVGDIKYAKAHDNLVPYTYRIVNINDMITKLPTKSYPDLEDSYHSRFEVWYPNGMVKGSKFIICNQAEQSSCSASSNDTMLPVHNSYFNEWRDLYIAVHDWFIAQVYANLDLLKKYYVEAQTFTFQNMPSEHIVKLVMWFELGCTYVIHSILAVLYIWSFVEYRRRLKSTTMTAAQKKEGRLLIQAVFSGIPCFVMMTFHHLFPFPFIELLGGDWCILNGPVTYLSFNSEVRSDWLELVGLKAAIKKIPYMNTFIRNKVGITPNAIGDTPDK